MPKIKKRVDVKKLLKDRQIKKVVRTAQKAFKGFKKIKPLLPSGSVSKKKFNQIFRETAAERRKRLEDAQKGIFR